jgi:glycosyltransferase involved in cell wall biosynthesis
MRILLVAASVSTEMSGVQRHAFNMARCLLSHPSVSSITLVLAPWQRVLVRTSGLHSGPRLSFHFAEMHNSSLSRLHWFYRVLPTLARQLQPDLVHLAFPAPTDAGSFSCPVVVSLHDLYPYEIPSNFGLLKGYCNRLILRQCLRAVNAIACVSETTLLRLNHDVPTHASQIACRIYNCVEPSSVNVPLIPLADWHGEPFLLCVAQHRRNKNVPFLIRTFKCLRKSADFNLATRLVIVGIQGPETHSILRTIRQAGLQDFVLLHQGLSESELQWCYRYCDAVISPSIVEGFGLPVVEALMAGCRVICSDIPAFREFGGGSCYVSLGKDTEATFAKAALTALREPRPHPVSMPELGAPVIADQYFKLYRRLLTPPIASHDVAFPECHSITEIERHSV